MFIFRELLISWDLGFVCLLAPLSQEISFENVEPKLEGSQSHHLLFVHRATSGVSGTGRRTDGRTPTVE